MSIESLKEQARRHEQKEEWRKALDQYRKAIARLEKDDQPDITLYNRVGDLFVRVADLDGAVEAYEKAVDLYVEAGLHNNAIAVCKKIVRSIPRRHEVYLKMGQIRASQGFVSDARTSFLTYAERMQQQGDLDESFRALIEFCELAPSEVDLRIAVGEQLATHGRSADAAAQLIIASHELVARGSEDRAQEVRARVLELDADADFSRPESGAVEELLESGPGFAFEGEEQERSAVGAGGTLDGFETTALSEPEVGEPEPRAGQEPSEPESPPPASEEPESSVEEASAPAEFERASEVVPVEDPAVALAEAVSEFTKEEWEDPDDFEEEAEPLPLISYEDDEEEAEAAPAATESPSSDETVGAVVEDELVPVETGPVDLAARIEASPEDVPLRQRALELAYQAGDAREIVAAFLGLAGALERSGDEARAAATYRHVLELEPGNEEAVAAMARVGEPVEHPVQEVAAHDDYVDLGSMLLGGEREKTTRFVVAYEEPTGDEDADFARMLAQFKEKVSQNLDAGDVKAHHDLGTAYKEMGLLDEAVAEFQQALRGSAAHLPTYELLGQAFMEMGNPAAAVRTLERALEIDFEVEDELLGIYYHLGRAYQEVGNRESALDFYDRVFALDINFLDVTERLRSLR